MAENEEYRFIPNPSEVLRDMQNAGTIHGEIWFKKFPDFLKATLLANGYKSYSEHAEEVILALEKYIEEKGSEEDG